MNRIPRSTVCLCLPFILGLSLNGFALGAAASPTESSDSGVVRWGHPFFRVYTDRDGLPQNIVRRLGLDAKGYLWIGTADGAAHYNGRVWTVVNMPNRTRSNDVCAMIVASDGAFWFGTNGGGVCRLKDGNWTVYDTSSGLPANPVFSLLETRSPDGRSVMWAGTYGGGLVRFENGVWKPEVSATGVPADAVVLCLLETTAADGVRTVWAGTRLEGVCALTNGLWRRYGASSGFPDRPVRCLLETKSPDGAATLWVGTDGGGLAALRDGKWSVHDTSAGLPSNSIECLIATDDHDGEAPWVGTIGGGLARLVSGRWETFDAASGLPGNDVLGLLETVSPEGLRTLWIGTDGGGLARFERNRWTIFDAASGLPHSSVRCFLESRRPAGGSTFWMGTYGGGLVRFENGVRTVFNRTAGLPDNRVQCLLETVSEAGARTLWVGTAGGLARFDGGRFTVVPGPFHPEVRSLLETTGPDGAKRLWVGTYAGLGKLENGKWTLYSTQTGELANNGVNCLRETVSASGRKRLWAGTYGGGLACCENDRWTTYGLDSGLPNTIVFGLFDDGRFLWVATNGGGVGRLDLDATPTRWTVFSDATKPALPNNVAHHVGADARNRLYVLTNKGVVRLTPRAPTPDDRAEYDIHVFTTEDGLPSNEGLPGAGLTDSPGRLWIGTAKGAAMFDPAREVIDRTPKPVFIEKIRVNGNETNARRLADASLAHDENNLVFEYALVGYFRESDTRYRTQLVGFEALPSNWTPDYKKEYTNLPEGEYRFRAWGRDHAGNVSAPAEIVLRVRAAPWRTWPAYLCYAIVLATSGRQVYAWRIRILKARQREKIRYLQQLLESTRAINSKLDLATVLQNIAEEAARLIDGEPSGIGLVEGGEVVFRRVWRGEGWDDMEVRVRLDDRVSGCVEFTAEPRIVNDPKNHPMIARPDLVERFGTVGFLEVPILARSGKVVGVLDVRRRAGGPEFTEAHQKLIESLADHAAVAIENAALYGELGEKNFELEQKNLVIGESMSELEKLYKKEQDVTRTLQELDEMKTGFLIVTSHEMRTPLTILKGYGEALATEALGSVNDVQRRALTTCLRVIDRMTLTFNDILEMLKIAEGRFLLKKERLNLAAAAHQAADELSPFVAQRGQTLIRVVPEDVFVWADPGKIDLILLNLIQNAVKFTPDGGTIRLSVSVENDFARVSVEDSGIGIEASELTRVFDRFYTSRDWSRHRSGRFEFAARGTGLGLAIVKSYIEAHGGRVWAESEGEGRGSAFHVLLPGTEHPAPSLRDASDSVGTTVGRD